MTDFETMPIGTKERLRELEKENERLNQQGAFFAAKSEELERKLEVAKECVRFYDTWANQDGLMFVWDGSEDDANPLGYFRENDIEILQSGSDSCDLFSGKRARQCLKEIGK
jgi:predicted nuclease with TOPRIM domain